MKSSDRIHRVAIQAKFIAQDTVGAEITQWVTAFSLWCAIYHEFRPTDDFIETANSQLYESKIWFNTQKTRRVLIIHRLYFEGRQYEILDIQDESGRNRETKILARHIKP